MKLNIPKSFSESSVEVLADILGNEVTDEKQKRKDISQTFDEITVLIELTGQLRGQVFYSMDQNFAISLASSMLGMPIKRYDSLVKSAISEIGNIITGNTMTKVSKSGFYCETTIPSITEGKDELLPIMDSLGTVIPIKTPIGTLTIGLSVSEY